MRICRKAVDGETPGDADVTGNSGFFTWRRHIMARCHGKKLGVV